MGSYRQLSYSQNLVMEWLPSLLFPFFPFVFFIKLHPLHNIINVQFEPSLITTDNDVSPIAFGNQTDPFTLAEETPNLQGVDELLDSVS